MLLEGKLDTRTGHVHEWLCNAVHILKERKVLRCRSDKTLCEVSRRKTTLNLNKQTNSQLWGNCICCRSNLMAININFYRMLTFTQKESGKRKNSLSAYSKVKESWMSFFEGTFKTTTLLSKLKGLIKYLVQTNDFWLQFWLDQYGFQVYFGMKPIEGLGRIIATGQYFLCLLLTDHEQEGRLFLQIL